MQKNTSSRSKNLFLAIFLFNLIVLIPSYGQRGSFNYTNKYSKKGYYFGIALGTNFNYYRVEKSLTLFGNDTIQTVNAVLRPGFHLGFIANFNLGRNVDFRLLIPTVAFSDKILSYQTTQKEQTDQTIESIFLEFPIYFRYKSKPYNDIRLFVVAGLKYSIDLASTADTRQGEEMIQLNQHDLAIEFGVGFQVFFPFFILSPEIKFSYGLKDLHERNESLIYSSVIDKLFSRGFSISLHFEG